jgi:hypothetical protein
MKARAAMDLLFGISDARRRSLTAEELDALRSWAKQHGRYWKEPLRALWCRAVITSGMPNSDRDTTVYCLRNSHGPSWLRDFRLPKEGSQ